MAAPRTVLIADPCPLNAATLTEVLAACGQRPGRPAPPPGPWPRPTSFGTRPGTWRRTARQYIESRELGTLVVLNRKVRDAGGRLALMNVRPFVAGVLEVTRLDTILDVRPAAA